MRSRKRLVPGPILGYEDGHPVVPVTLERHPKGNLLHLEACPYCGWSHIHGGGGPGKDPRDYEGPRAPHCDGRAPGAPDYILRIVGERPGPTDPRRTSSSRSARPDKGQNRTGSPAPRDNKDGPGVEVEEAL